MLNLLTHLILVLPMNKDCPTAVIKVPAGDFATLEDRKQARDAERGCYVRYTDSPCLKKLERTGENDYTVRCGSKDSLTWQEGDE